jgi:hypothetical protein
MLHSLAVYCAVLKVVDSYQNVVVVQTVHEDDLESVNSCVRTVK